MSLYKILEVFDGRLPEYRVMKENIVIKTFDSYEEALKWSEDKNTTPCGEENPCE